MNPDSDHPQLPSINIHHASSSSSTPSASTSTTTARKIGVAVDLSEESAFAVRWAVNHHIRPGDTVILIHVSPTSGPIGADWGPLPQQSPTPSSDPSLPQPQPSQEDFDAYTATKLEDLAEPLKEEGFPYKIHIVKDHDMRERLCLEIERLNLSAVIMGSRGVGAETSGSDGRLGSVSDYCVHHCISPVVVVRYPNERSNGNTGPKSTGHAVVTVKEATDVEEEGEETRPGTASAHHDHIKG